MIAAERKHGKGVTADRTGLEIQGRGCHLGTHDRSQEYAVVPVKGLVHQGHSAGTPAAKEEGADGHTRRVFP